MLARAWAGHVGGSFFAQVPTAGTTTTCLLASFGLFQLFSLSFFEVRAMVKAPDHMYLFHMVDTELFGLILETVEKSREPF